jgi:hypothetical protein
MPVGQKPDSCTDLCTRRGETRRDGGDTEDLRRLRSAGPPRPVRRPETARDGGDARRMAHNPEVEGSNPSPATKRSTSEPCLPAEAGFCRSRGACRAVALWEGVTSCAVGPWLVLRQAAFASRAAPYLMPQAARPPRAPRSWRPRPVRKRHRCSIAAAGAAAMLHRCCFPEWRDGPEAWLAGGVRLAGHTRQARRTRAAAGGDGAALGRQDQRRGKRNLLRR